MDEDSEAASSNGVDLSSPVPPDDEILRNLLEAVLVRSKLNQATLKVLTRVCNYFRKRSACLDRNEV